MELVLKKKQKKVRSSKNSLPGLASFLLSLIALIGVNIFLLLELDALQSLIFFQLPAVSIVLGLVGLVLRNRSNAFAIIGIVLSLFIFIFFIMMFGLAWTINPKP